MSALQLKTIMAQLETWAPLKLAARWDNSGLQIGHPDQEVKDVLIAMDVDDAVLQYIQGHPADLVITHHPLFFKSIKQIRVGSDLARSLTVFLNSGVQLYTMHTNLDAAPNGVTDALIRAYGFDPMNAEPLSEPYGKIVSVSPELSIESLSHKFPARLRGAQTRTTCTKIGFCGGSGGSFIEEAYAQGAECFITGEINYHQELFCQMNDMMCLELGHKQSELFVLPVLKTYLENQFPSLKVTLCP